MNRILTLSCVLSFGAVVACTSGGSSSKAANCPGFAPGTYEGEQGSEKVVIQVERDSDKNLVFFDSGGTVLFTVDGKTKTDGTTQGTKTATCIGGSVKLLGTTAGKESTAVLTISGDGIRVELDDTPPTPPYILKRVGPPTAKLSPADAAPATDASESVGPACVGFAGTYIRADTNEQVSITKIAENLVSVAPSSHKPALIDGSGNRQGDILILGGCQNGEIVISYNSDTAADDGYLQYSKTPTGIHEVSNFDGVMKEADYVRQ